MDQIIGNINQIPQLIYENSGNSFELAHNFVDLNGQFHLIPKEKQSEGFQKIESLFSNSKSIIDVKEGLTVRIDRNFHTVNKEAPNLSASLKQQNNVEECEFDSKLQRQVKNCSSVLPEYSSNSTKDKLPYWRNVNSFGI